MSRKKYTIPFISNKKKREELKKVQLKCDCCGFVIPYTIKGRLRAYDLAINGNGKEVLICRVCVDWQWRDDL